MIDPNEHAMLEAIAHRLEGYAIMLDSMGLALDALYLRESSARIRSKVGDPDAWKAFEDRYKGADVVEQDEPQGG